MAKSQNALDMIPIRRPHVKWDHEGNLIKLKIYRNHWYDKILHRVFKTPLEITIDLDEIGSTVWQLIDGETTIRQIGEKLQEQMGEMVEPTYARLSMFMRYLYNADLIYYRKVKR